MVGGLTILPSNGFIAWADLDSTEWSGIQQGKDGYPTYYDNGRHSGYLIADDYQNSFNFNPQIFEFYGFTI